jgi:hypothetical protein
MVYSVDDKPLFVVLHPPGSEIAASDGKINVYLVYFTFIGRPRSVN